LAWGKRRRLPANVAFRVRFNPKLSAHVDDFRPADSRLASTTLSRICLGWHNGTGETDLRPDLLLPVPSAVRATGLLDWLEPSAVWVKGTAGDQDISGYGGLMNIMLFNMVRLHAELLLLSPGESYLLSTGAMFTFVI
jgi:hypothetical protein